MPVIKKKTPIIVQPSVSTVKVHSQVPETEPQKIVPVGSAVDLSQGNVGLIGVHFSRKYTDGNYGNFTVSCSCTLPCDPTPAGMQKAFNKASAFAEKKMEEMLAGTPVSPK